jgi:N6-L-threonylcarbamoyladenine synthase
VKVLGIETSCDETAAAVVEDGKRLLSNVVASSMDLHAKYGGVIPEIAARSHIEAITPVIQEALEQADCTWDDIDAIAVTYGAGLGGSLLIGVMTARTLAITKAKPLYAINHVEAHIYANFLTSAGPGSPASEQSSKLREPSSRDAALGAPLLSRSSTSTVSSAARSRLASHQSPANVKTWKLGDQTYTLPVEQPEFPMLGLIVSGGHSQLVVWRGHLDYTLLGQTNDDAIGEAFDKVAKILGLPYPGGPAIGMKAKEGNPHAYQFPKAHMKDKYDFSFSGLKTAVLREAQKAIGEDYTFPSSKLSERLSEAQKADIAASFQRIAIETVVDKTLTAFNEFSPKSVVIGGGVAASPELRRQLSERLPLPIEYTDMKLCTDNGAMVATLGCYKMRKGQPAADPYTLEIEPNLSM